MGLSEWISGGKVEGGEEGLEFGVVPALDAALGPVGENGLHLAPVFAVGEDVFADGEVFLVAEILLGDVGTQVVEVSLPDLLRRELRIAKGLLGIRALISFHFSPNLPTHPDAAWSSWGVHWRSFPPREMRR